MPRPKKCRRVCRFPQAMKFSPALEEEYRPEILLTVDEYEAVRLIDREGLSQEECGRRMGVARTTVQQIYACARKKLADMLVEARPLRIGGGDFRLCDMPPGRAGCGGCFRAPYDRIIQAKGDHTMRIAVTYEEGSIFQHFGHTRQFKLYDTNGKEILSSQVVESDGSGHGALAGLLAALEVDVLICGGIGGGAQAALEEAGIKLYGGVSGQADAAAAALLEGRLDYDPQVICSHHDQQHHDGHSCGEHDCGTHHCRH